MRVTLLKTWRTFWKSSVSPKYRLTYKPAQRSDLSSGTIENRVNVTDGQSKSLPGSHIRASTHPALWQRLGPLSNAFIAYNKAQNKRPLATNVAASLAIYCLGDFFAQQFGGEKYDKKRTLRALFIGVTVAIPAYKW